MKPSTFTKKKQDNGLHVILAGVFQLFILILFAAQIQAQVIPATNTIGTCGVCAPPGWYIVAGSTDVSNRTHWSGNLSYPWVGTVIDPPNTHVTWVNGYKTEIAGVDITGLTVGTTYDFDFYMAELQSNAGGTVVPNFDGILNIYDCNSNTVLGNFAFSGGPNNAWTLQTLTFTATAATQAVCFKYLSSTGQNGNFWNGNFWNVSFGGNVVTPSCDLTSALAAVNVLCHGDATGAATATATNGTPPYTYLWSTGANSPSINGLTAGSYTVSITDADGCEEIGSAVISEPADLKIGVTATTIPCAGNTGTATVSMSGGTPGYTYLWSDGQTSPTATGLSAGTIFVTVRDANQCQIIGSVTVVGGRAMSLDLSSTDVTCYAEKDGTATATVTGGTPPYNYLWNNGQSMMTANTLDEGSYSVVVTDAAGCQVTGTVAIAEPARVSILFNVANVGCDSLDDGMTTASNIGGIPPISYQWDTNAGNQTTTTASNLAAGVYHVTLTDSNGCDAVAGTTVNSKDCAQPCPIDPCVEAVINNTNICTVISNDPGDPLAVLDCDGDGVTNAAECTDGTDPLDPCDFEDTSITLPVTADQSDCPVPTPDLTPIMTILPGNIAGLSAVEVAIQITELDSVDTNGSVIIVRVPSDPRFIFVWDIGLTLAALVPVQNADWNYLGDNGFVHTWTYNGSGLIIGAKDMSAFGFQSFYDPQGTDGQTTLTATVLPYSGGETNALNNTDSERLVYFE